MAKPTQGSLRRRFFYGSLVLIIHLSKKNHPEIGHLSNWLFCPIYHLGSVLNHLLENNFQQLVKIQSSLFSNLVYNSIFFLIALIRWNQCKKSCYFVDLYPRLKQSLCLEHYFQSYDGNLRKYLWNLQKCQFQ